MMFDRRSQVLQHMNSPLKEKAPHAALQDWSELVSALVDGECHPDELDVLLQAGPQRQALHEVWSCYHAVGAALRGPVVDPSLPPSGDFAALVMARLAGA